VAKTPSHRVRLTDLGATYTEKRRNRQNAARTSNGKVLLMDAPIVAIDGEGMTDEWCSKHYPGKCPRRPKDPCPFPYHRYTLLMDSTGRKISSHDLSTNDCLEWLCGLPAKCLLVGYSLSYDVAMFLRNANVDELERLKLGQKVRFGDFSIRYVPRKEFTVYDERTVTWTTKGPQYRVQRHVYDVFGFFQHSFVESLKEWGIGTP
jgi:hypothetical protein